MLQAEPLLRFLSSEVPECHEEACRVLMLRQLAEVLPSGQEVSIANEGGLMYFVAESESSRPEAPMAGQSKSSCSGTGQQEPKEDLMSCKDDLISCRDDLISCMGLSTQDLFPIGCNVEAHSLMATKLNGLRGKVVGYSAERVKVDFGAEGIKSIKPVNLKVYRAAVASMPNAKDDLITLPGPQSVDLIELSDANTTVGKPRPDGFAAQPEADLLSFVAECPSSSSQACTLLPEDLDFSQPAPTPPVQLRRVSVPEVFNISDGDSSYEAASNPELVKMFSFSPKHAPKIPFLGTGRDRGPLFPGHDPFGSIVADAYVQCLKA
jgi:hypothetical protein